MNYELVATVDGKIHKFRYTAKSMVEAVKMLFKDYPFVERADSLTCRSTRS